MWNLRECVDDLSSYYKSALAVVAPIFKGVGYENESVEAMSFGKSIIGTDEAFQGIECDYCSYGGEMWIRHQSLFIL